MSGARANELTVLDYLNEDCWRSLLDFVPVRDIIRTESASRRWQQMVQVYLSSVRFAITRSKSKKQNLRCLKPNEVDCKLLSRIGLSVVTADINTKGMLKMVSENCPNIKAVKFHRLREELLVTVADNFKCLQDLDFQECTNELETLEINADDADCMSDFDGWEIRSDGHEPKRITGECLVHHEVASLKTLTLQRSDDLEFRYLLSAADYLKLTTLSIYHASDEILKKMHLIVDKISTLEHLFVWVQNVKNDRFFKSVCHLGGLKRLSVDIPATDEDLEAVARCCPLLTTLELGFCHAVTKRGVAAVCSRAGARLTALGFQFGARLTDDDAVACIRACPNLEYLDFTFCEGMTAALLPRAAAARREQHALRPLQLCLMHVLENKDGRTQEYEELNLIL